jgi:hypothetical protein
MQVEDEYLMIDCLDQLLTDSEQHGTFHDAILLKSRQTNDCTELHFSLCIGDPDSTELDERELRRSGVLMVYGIHDWQFDPCDATLSKVGSEWLTDDGPVSELNSDAAQRFANGVPQHLRCHYLFFSDTNSFLFVACERMEFRWAA